MVEGSVNLKKMKIWDVKCPIHKRHTRLFYVSSLIIHHLFQWSVCLEKVSEDNGRCWESVKIRKLAFSSGLQWWLLTHRVDASVITTPLQQFLKLFKSSLSITSNQIHTLLRNVSEALTLLSFQTSSASTAGLSFQCLFFLKLKDVSLKKIKLSFYTGKEVLV